MTLSALACKTYPLADPGYILETEDIDTFINGIAGLSANGGGDTPEPSIGALIRAIKASEDGSPIYLFTDAPPSDPHLQTEAIALITEKSVSVTFALVSPFRKRSVDNKMQEQNHVETKRQTSEVYSALAAISGGQVLTLQTSELSNLSSLIEFSANPARTTILRDSGEVLSSEPYTFYIDSSIEQVIIAINGDGTQVSITTPTGTSPLPFLCSHKPAIYVIITYAFLHQLLNSFLYFRNSSINFGAVFYIAAVTIITHSNHYY